MSNVEIKRSARYHAAVGLFCTNFLDFYDMMVLSMALTLIIKTFKLSLAQAGLLGTVTLIGCGVSVLVTGWIAENKGRKTAILFSLIGFSILTSAIGIASSYVEVLILRGLAGICLGGIITLVGTLLNETWPANLRGRVTTVVMTSSAFGVLTASTLVGVIAPRYGWRVLFIFALIGLVIALYVAIFVPESPVWKANRDNKKDKVITPLGEGLKEIFSGKLRRSSIFGTVVAFCAQLSYWGFMFWFPTFLIKERGLNPAAVGGYIAFMTIGALVGGPIMGVVSDYIGRRKSLMILMLAGGIFIPLYVMSKNVQFLFWFSPFIALSFSYPGLLTTYLPELYPTHVRSLGFGFTFNFARALSAIGPYTLGAVAASLSLQTSISWVGLIYFIGGISIIFLPETLKKKENMNNIVIGEAK